MAKPKADESARSVSSRHPAFFEWLVPQTVNVDPVRAEAAQHITSRWAMTGWYRHDRVLRALEREGSPHLAGAIALAEDYAEQFGSEASTLLDRGAAIIPFRPAGRVDCTHQYRSGRVCRAEAAPGTDLCGRHGGKWLNEDERRDLAAAVHDQVLEATGAALRVVTDLMDNGVSEKVRLDAALAVLDRAGIGPASTVKLEVSESAEQAAEIVRQRVEALARRMQSGEPAEIEVEVVDSDAEPVT